MCQFWSCAGCVASIDVVVLNRRRERYFVAKRSWKKRQNFKFCDQFFCLLGFPTPLMKTPQNPHYPQKTQLELQIQYDAPYLQINLIQIFPLLISDCFNENSLAYIIKNNYIFEFYCREQSIKLFYTIGHPSLSAPNV